MNMKTIGMLGGMSWQSTASYYKAINQGIQEKLGDSHSARICMYSVNFEEIKDLQHQEKWQETADILIAAASAVERGGADFIIICTNTMHKLVPEIEAEIAIPILHIADATAKCLREDQVKKVGLLGTRFTMEKDFYKGRLQEKYDLDVITPNEKQRNEVHDIIYDELCLGTINDTSRQKYVDIVDDLHAKGAEAVILGCTEIAMLIQQKHTTVPLYDTTVIHAKAAVDMAIGIN